MLLSGSATTVAIETDVVSNMSNPNQVVILWGDDITSQTPTFVEYAGVDINYNGSATVDIDTITLTGGSVWLVSYTLTLATPNDPNDVLVYMHTTGIFTILPASQSKVFRSTNGLYTTTISPSFPILRSIQMIGVVKKAILIND